MDPKDMVPGYEPGNCYEYAASVVVGHHPWTSLLPRDAAGIRLCHGTPTLTVPPYRPYGHAWVEYTWHRVPWVLDGGIGAQALKVLYYRAGKIDPKSVRVYTKEQAALWMVRSRHYGPWESDDDAE